FFGPGPITARRLPFLGPFGKGNHKHLARKTLRSQLRLQFREIATSLSCDLNGMMDSYPRYRTGRSIWLMFSRRFASRRHEHLFGGGHLRKGVALYIAG